MAHTTQATWSRQTLSEEKALGKLIVNFRDTSDERSSFIVASARAALKALHKGDLKNFSEVAKRMVEECTSRYEGAWHCCVGESFGCHMTEESDSTMCFQFGKVAFLIFKHG